MYMIYFILYLGLNNDKIVYQINLIIGIFNLNFQYILHILRVLTKVNQEDLVLTDES